MRPVVALAVALLGGAPSHAAASDNHESFPIVRPSGPGSAIADLPDTHGFAGMYAGRLADRLVVAGGANFPDAPPWQGGQKQWYDVIWWYDAPAGRWRQSATRLASPRAYGISVTATLDGRPAVICAGGDDGQTVFSDVFALVWENGDVRLRSLPPLPAPRTQHCAALLEQQLLVACGQSAVDAAMGNREAYLLDLSVPQNKRRWARIAPLPGAGRIQAIAASDDRHYYVVGGIELISGSNDQPQRVVPYLRTGYRWEPSDEFDIEPLGRWMPIDPLPFPAAAAPSPAMRAGRSQFILLGGADGSRTDIDASLHPGFAARVQAYDVVLQRWAAHGELPEQLSRVTCPLVPLDDGRYAIISGETRPGVRSPGVVVVEPNTARSALLATDWIVLGAYLAVLVAIGVYCSGRKHTADDFFLAGRRVPWWAAGISVFGTQLSAITFLAVPARTFATNWTYYLLNLGILGIAPIVIHGYLPRFRGRPITSAYEFLEQRFGLSLRLFGSASFIMFQLGRMGIVVLLPALALAAVTGIDLLICIALIGILSTLYTVLGGMEAVVWTDVLQVLVLIGGALAALVAMMLRIDGGLWTVITTGAEFDKFRLVQLQTNLLEDALPVIVLGAVFTNLVSYTTDQAVVQRYLSTPTQSAAARAILGNGVMSVFVSALFFFVGTSLFVYYYQYPGRMIPLKEADQLFPWFIAKELPAGVSGLVIAAVFAAAMSSLDSSMHSIATALTTDFVKRFRPNVTDRWLLRFAQQATLVLGTAGTLTAIYLSTLDTRFLWDFFIELLGLMGGTLSGLFMLGVFTRRCRSLHAWLGTIASLGLLAWVKFQTPISPLAYAAIGTLACFSVGVLASWIDRRGVAAA